jgi:hypothetical protein
MFRFLLSVVALVALTAAVASPLKGDETQTVIYDIAAQPRLPQQKQSFRTRPTMSRSSPRARFPRRRMRHTAFCTPRAGSRSCRRTPTSSTSQ